MPLYLVRGLPDATLSGQRNSSVCPKIFKNTTLSGRQMPRYLYRYCTAAGEISGRGARRSAAQGCAPGRAEAARATVHACTPLAKAQCQLRSPVQLLPPVRRFSWMPLYLVRMPLYLVRMPLYLVGQNPVNPPKSKKCNFIWLSGNATLSGFLDATYLYRYRPLTRTGGFFFGISWKKCPQFKNKTPSLKNPPV